jgi:signal transduction histidine kinase
MTAATLAQAQGPSAAAVLALPADTAKVIKLSDLCFAYRRVDADSAMLFGNAALQLARKLHFKKGEAQACNDLAIINIDRSDYGTADSLLLRSLALRTQLKDSAGMAAVHNKRGIIFQSRFMLEEALEEDLNALRIYERTGPPSHEATILNNIGILQFNLHRLPEALATHRQAAAIRERTGDGAGLAQSRGNQANVEAQLGDTAAAIAHFNAAITYFREHRLMPELAVQLNNLAGIYMAQGDLGAAAERYGEALAIRRGSGQRKAIASSMIGLGGTLLRQGHYAAARDTLLRALSLGREVGARSEQLQALLDLARLHAKLNQGDSTFWYQQQYTALKDSIFNEDLNMRMAHAETKFRTEQKERKILAQRAEISELERRSEQRKFWLFTALGGAALAMVTALLLFQVQRRKARARQDALIIAEREAGLRGVLAATEAERKRIASELHDGVGQQLTGLRFRLEEIASATGTGKPTSSTAVAEALALADDAGREVRHIAHAMMPKALGDLGLGPAVADMLERALGGTGITHEFGPMGLNGRLPKEVETGVYRIAQELVQNTMKHAGAKRVSLQLLLNKGHLVMIYEDDGKGISPAETGGGIGLRNIRGRAHALRASFHIGNGDPGGILATLRVPIG